MLNFIRKYFKDKNIKIRRKENILYKLSILNRAVQYRLNLLNNNIKITSI